MDLSLSISMAYNVISCQKFAINTQILKILKIADFAMIFGLPRSEITKTNPKTGRLIS